MSTFSTRAKIIFISTLGSLIENYDFAIYGFFAATLTQLFFPKNEPSINMILAYSVFTAGYIVRPLGAIVFGHLGDVLGRKAGLVLSMICMSIPLLFMALLPTYERIGFAASFIINCMSLTARSFRRR